jgi:hypothetical protein
MDAPPQSDINNPTGLEATTFLFLEQQNQEAKKGLQWAQRKAQQNLDEMEKVYKEIVDIINQSMEQTPNWMRGMIVLNPVSLSIWIQNLHQQGTQAYYDEVKRCKREIEQCATTLEQNKMVLQHTNELQAYRIREELAQKEDNN